MTSRNPEAQTSSTEIGVSSIENEAVLNYLLLILIDELLRLCRFLKLFCVFSFCLGVSFKRVRISALLPPPPSPPPFQNFLDLSLI